MDHETAITRLADWVEGRLEPAAAAAMAAHARDCTECREVADTLRRVRQQVAAHGRPLFEPHPTAEDLARFVLDPRALPLEALASIGAHVRACPACDAERAQVRGATAVSPWRALEAWLGAAPGPAAWLRPALALVAVALVYPAYLGLSEYPRARARADRLESVAGTAPPTSPRTPAWGGGGVDALVLTGAARGSGEALPSIRIRPGQPAQPVLVDFALPVGLDPVTVTLVDASSSVSWRLDGRRSEIWDARQGLVALLVPADRLAPGEYRLEIAARGAPSPAFRARFRVRDPATR